MKKTQRISNIVFGALSALMMLALLLCQFAPFWQYADPEGSLKTSSLQGYIWFPNNDKALGDMLATSADGFDINALVTCPVFQLLFASAGILLFLFMPRSILPALLGGFAGIFGIAGFATQPLLRLGLNWGLQLALNIALLVIAALALLSVFFQRKEMKKS